MNKEVRTVVYNEQRRSGSSPTRRRSWASRSARRCPEVVGADVRDESGHTHLGIIEFPVPILRGSPESIKALREKLYEPDFQALTVVDFSDLAQSCKTYDEFIGRMAQVPESTLQYFGVAVCGAKKKVNKLTGSGEPKKYLKITLDK